MKNTLNRIIIIIIAVIFVPTVFFSVYEFGSLRDNEKVIDKIYENQLDAILFSINQYTQDILSSIAEKISYVYGKPAGLNRDNYKNFFNEVSALNHIIVDIEDSNSFIFSREAKHVKGLLKEIKDTIENHSEQIERMKTYKRGGYRKLESFHLSNDNTLIIFISEKGDTTYRLTGITINPEFFITHLLDPKIQEIARGKFFIIAYFNDENRIIYKSDRQYSLNGIAYQKEFWLFKNYYMGIELKDQTIKELVRSRTRSNLFVIILIDLLLIFGAFLIFRNVKKEIELTRIKSDFISNVSHEIRTPLGLISMYIETLEMGRVKSKDKEKEYYGIILKETQRLSGIVNKILNFSQIESGKRKYNMSDGNLSEIANNVVDTYKFHLEKKGFSYKLNTLDNLPSVKIDKEAVTDAVVNLVDNAVKYSEGNKHIDISTGVKGQYAFIEVCDRGIGISEKDQKQIFDKFFRVTQGSLAHKAKGSGLGLSIVKHIMDAHKGKINIESLRGKGSTFRLEFPVY